MNSGAWDAIPTWKLRVCFVTGDSAGAWIFQLLAIREVSVCESVLRYCNLSVRHSHSASRKKTYLEHWELDKSLEITHFHSFYRRGCGSVEGKVTHVLSLASVSGWWTWWSEKKGIQVMCCESNLTALQLVPVMKAAKM